MRFQRKINNSFLIYSLTTGTGKTQVIVNTILQLLNDEAHKQQKVPMKILVCASTEPAIDEIVLRIYSILQTLKRMDFIYYFMPHLF